MSTTLTYCNPFWPHAFPDPFVLKVRGRYYAYATEPVARPDTGTRVFPILTSSDLVHWDDAGKALAAFGAPYHHYWAPEVTVYNGQFFLYYAVHTEEFKGGIRVAVADAPTGPFVDSGHDLTAAYLPWAIDPHVFRDQDGQYYLYMTIDYWNDPITGFTGSGNAVARLHDPFTLQGEITRVTPPSSRWQLFEAKRPEKGGIDWYTVEGPCVLHHRTRYYEMFSGGCYYRDNYAMSYATSSIPLGPEGMRDTSWQEQKERGGQPFLIRGDGERAISPGHNSVVLGPNNVEHYLVYHALQRDMLERHPYLDRLLWHGESLWTPAPTTTPQPVPTMPRMRELFEDDTLSPRWQAQSGNWSIVDDTVIQDDATCPRTSLQRQEELDANWLLEVNLRSLSEHNAPNGSYGVALYNDSRDALHLALTPNGYLLVTSTEALTEPIRKLALPEGTNMQAWHQLLLRRSGSTLSLQLDGLPLLTMPLQAAISRFALLTELSRAAFSGISLTDHYQDEFLDPSYSLAMLGWRDGEARQNKQATEAPIEEALTDWHRQAGMIEQTNSGPGIHTLLKGSAYEEYEFSTTLRLQPAREHAEAAAGCVLLGSEGNKTFIWLLQRSSGWQIAIESRSAPSSLGNTARNLPTTFHPLDWHTLRLLRQSSSLSIYLDGASIFTLPLRSQPEVAGLATRDTSAAFMSVALTS